MDSHEIELVTITLGDDEFTLVPSAKAMSKISKAFSGVYNAVDAVQRLNVEAISLIIATGAGLSDEARDALPAKIFTNGVLELMPLVVRFLSLLMTGGKRVVSELEAQ